MEWTAWNNRAWNESGAGYGLKVPIADRDAHFSRSSASVIIELPTPSGVLEVSVGTAKPSFWNDTCHELISKEIGKWLIDSGLAPWKKGKPPHLEVEMVDAGRFRLVAPGGADDSGL
ncbi:MAG: hypothetical protein KDB18_04165 [Salinibacterium sp.]|nr:hypothetical protein [Salinibacterium sp.]